MHFLVSALFVQCKWCAKHSIANGKSGNQSCIWLRDSGWSSKWHNAECPSEAFWMALGVHWAWIVQDSRRLWLWMGKMCAIAWVQGQQLLRRRICVVMLRKSCLKPFLNIHVYLDVAELATITLIYYLIFSYKEEKIFFICTFIFIPTIKVKIYFTSKSEIKLGK